MLIECLIFRPKGTVVTIDDQTYTFISQTPGQPTPQVCEVVNPDHIARFLSITEGYRPANPADVPATAPVAPRSVASAAIFPGVSTYQQEARHGDQPYASEYDAMSDDDLRDKYTAVFGKRPGRAARITMITALKNVPKE